MRISRALPIFLLLHPLPHVAAQGRVLYLKAHPSNDTKAVSRVVEMAKRRKITVHFLPYIES